MKTRMTVSTAVVLAIGFGVGIWAVTRGADTSSATAAVAPAKPAPAQPAKTPAAPPEPVKQAQAIQTPAPAPIPEPVSVPPAEQAVQTPVAKMLTADTLKNTRWVDGPVDVVFLPDGQWQMNGRICAKWVVEGSRVKIFDDKGEVHYVDIVGDTLEFNGKKIGRASPAQAG